MTAPTIATLPTWPNRSLSEAAFDTAADAIGPALVTWTTEANALAVFCGTKAEETLAASLSGNLGEIDLSAMAGYLIGVNLAGDAVEGVEIVETPAATQGEAEAGTATGVYMDPLRTANAISAQVPDLLNASGSAPLFAPRAWGNFNGTGTVAIRASGNVSSIVDLGTGRLRVNLLEAMPDTNYAIIVSGSVAVGDTDTNRIANPGSDNKTTTSFEITTGSGASNTKIDFQFIYFAIFR